MYDHVSLGVTNLENSLAFYDAALGSLGVTQMFAMSHEGIAGYKGTTGSTSWIYAKDQQQAPLGQVLPPPRFPMALQATSRAAVDVFLLPGGDRPGRQRRRRSRHSCPVPCSLCI